MNKKTVKYVKLSITIAIVLLFVWFLVLYPYIKFKGYERMMEKAGERYFSINSSELPSGERIETITLQQLYYKAFLKEDFYIPYTKKPCSLKESFIKVRREDGEYKYYTYLQCGVISSNVDHKGPTINLNGKEKMTITKGEKFSDPGIKSVVDNVDGKLDISKVTIKGKVDSSKVGKYEITYSAKDSLNNKTEVVREVEVVERLISTAKEATKDSNGYYVGEALNNYVLFSGMLFRIMAVDGDNVKIVAARDIANINYSGIDKWLDDYFYDHLNKESKKLIVDNKYCNMNVTNDNLNTKECNSYTKSRKSYIPSIVDVNLTIDSNRVSYLRPTTMSWVANSLDNDTGYVTRNFFSGEYFDTVFMSINKKYNFGVRPVITIKGSTLIKSGTGTEDNPYNLGDLTSGKVDDKINTRFTGEYVKISGNLYRIIETLKDGTTKVIAENSVFNDNEQITTRYEVASDSEVYNPKQQGNVGYFINNKVSEYVDTSYFINHEIEVPIYKGDAKYGEESQVKKYKVKLSAPNMYEMFSASSGDASLKSFWLINSSLDNKLKYGLSDVGVVMYYEDGEPNYYAFGIRPVGYLNSKCSIVSGKGTKNNPYIIDK